MANTVTAFEQGTMELENKLIGENQFDFDLGQELVKESMQQQPCSRSANDMVFTNDNELNKFLDCNNAMEFDEPNTENLLEKDPKTKMKSENEIEIGNEKRIEIEKLTEIENDLERPDSEKWLEKDPIDKPDMDKLLENGIENEPEPKMESKIEKLLEKDPMHEPEMRPKTERYQISFTRKLV